MNRQPRRVLTLVMSLVLMIFSVCQAQARASVLPASLPAPHEMMASCHQAAADSAVPNCHSTCDHLQQHHDAGAPDTLPDFHPVLVAIADPYLPQAAQDLPGTTRYHPPDPLQTDPPLTIRFQRFLN